jgi:hypothetical protein
MHARAATAIGAVAIALSIASGIALWLLVLDREIQCVPYAESEGIRLDACRLHTLWIPGLGDRETQVRGPDGELLWSHPGETLSLGPVDRHVLTHIEADGTMIARDIRDGHVLWRRPDEAIAFVFDLGDVTVIVHGHPQVAHVVVREGGHERFSRELAEPLPLFPGDPRTSEVAAFGDTELVLGTSFVDRTTGAEREPIGPAVRCRTDREVLWLDDDGALHRRASGETARIVDLGEHRSIRCADVEGALLVALGPYLDRDGAIVPELDLAALGAITPPGAPPPRPAEPRAPIEPVLLRLGPDDRALWRSPLDAMPRGWCAPASARGRWTLDVPWGSRTYDLETGALAAERRYGVDCPEFEDLVEHPRD